MTSLILFLALFQSPKPPQTISGALVFMGKDWKELGRCTPASDNTFDHPHYAKCTFSVDSAEIVTMMLQSWRASDNQYNKCGDFGPWVLDEKGNIMGRFRNPPCPK